MMGIDCDDVVECYLDHVNIRGEVYVSHQIFSVRITSRTPTG